MSKKKKKRNPTTVRSLCGEHYRGYELTVSATEPEAYAKLLHQAARVVKRCEALAVQLMGPYWREADDEFVLSIVISVDPRTAPEWSAP